MATYKFFFQFAISDFLAFAFKIPVTEKLVHELRERIYLSQIPSSVAQDPPNFIQALNNDTTPIFPKSRTLNFGKRAIVFNPESGLNLAEYKRQDEVCIHAWYICLLALNNYKYKTHSNGMKLRILDHSMLQRLLLQLCRSV